MWKNAWACRQDGRSRLGSANRTRLLCFCVSAVDYDGQETVKAVLVEIKPDPPRLSRKQWIEKQGGGLTHPTRRDGLPTALKSVRTTPAWSDIQTSTGSSTFGRVRGKRFSVFFEPERGQTRRITNESGAN